MAEEMPAWFAALDEDDRAACVLELEDVLPGQDGHPGALEAALAAWKATGEALSDPAVREVLTGDLSDVEFVEVGPPNAPDPVQDAADAVWDIRGELWMGERYDLLRTIVTDVYHAGLTAGRAAERRRMLTSLREFLPQYFGLVIHGHTADGNPIYASGPIAFPDALVDTFALMSTPDVDLLDGDDEPPCYCAETSTRNCPAHGNGDGNA